MSRFEKTNLNIAFRVYVSLGIACGVFFMLGLRLWFLQIVRGDYFRYLSENNRIRTVYVQAPRGRVFDRHGDVFVKNRPAFNLELITEDCPDVKSTLSRVEEILDVEPGQLTKKNPYQRRRRAYEPRLILRDISRDMVARVSGRKYDLPGVAIGVVPARNYIHGAVGSHSLGYIREISKEQLSQSLYARSRTGDFVGQYGLEKRLENELKGVRGLHRVEVNARGTRIGEFSFEPERAGHDVTLTIDLKVQAAADLALEGQRGAVFAMDPNSGEVLAMSSSPSFDPNLFTREVSPEIWRDLAAGKDKKLTNRALQGEYPPGSIFKMIVGLAALSEGVIGKNEKINCPGFLRFGRRNYHCHKRAGHGKVNFERALIQSCDVYFYTVGQRLGVDRIHDYSSRFGLGRISGLDLVPESRGLIPSTEWKKRYFKKREDQKWYPGETLSVAIGQGAVTVTPAQMAKAVSALVNGGKVMRPYLVSEVRSREGLVLESFQPVVESTMDVDQSVVKLVRKAMVGVVNDVKGTGKRARLEGIEPVVVGGKTGTAQVVALGMEGTNERFKDHAWFVSFAPAEKPEIAIAVLVENGGHGGVAAAPISRQVMEAFFGRKSPGKKMELSSGAEDAGVNSNLERNEHT